jgi:hypothetical protein
MMSFLLKHHLNLHRVPNWVHQQVYLHPYPKELMIVRSHCSGGGFCQVKPDRLHVLPGWLTELMMRDLLQNRATTAIATANTRATLSGTT